MKRKIIFIFLILIPAQIIYSETVNIVGTGSGASILKAVAAEFSRLNPGIKVNVPYSIGSGGGIKAVIEDKELMGRIARDLKSREKSYGINVVSFAKIPVVIFVNRSVALSDISSSSFCGIYGGKIRDWEELNGGKGKIRVIKRENNDSSDTVLRQVLECFRYLEITKRSKTTYTDPSTIEECSSQKNAIAFGAWPDVKKVKNVRALKLDGVHPENNEYQCVGMLSIIYRDVNYKGAVKKIVEFVKSRRAGQIIKNAGGIPVF